MMNLTREQVENADLILVADPEGAYQWSSHRTADEVANFLEDIADKIRADRDAAATAPKEK